MYITLIFSLWINVNFIYVISISYLNIHHVGRYPKFSYHVTFWIESNIDSVIYTVETDSNDILIKSHWIMCGLENVYKTTALFDYNNQTSWNCTKLNITYQMN